MTIYAIEMEAHTGAGGVQKFYAASAAFNTGPNDLPAHTHFQPALKTPLNFERHLFSPGATSGNSTVAFGEIVIINAHGRFDDWADYSFSGRPVIVKVIKQDIFNLPKGMYKDASIMLRGTIESLDITDAFTTLRLRIHDRLADLDKPLLTTRYLGTTLSAGATAEGPATLKDTIKPRVYGLVRNLTPIDVNPFDLIRQVSDRACSAITVYDGGQQLTLNGDYATIDALRSATLSPGQYATSLVLGLFRLGGTPALGVTADVTGTQARDAASLVRRMMLDFGMTTADIDQTSLTALATLNGSSCGLWVNDDRTAIAAIQAMLQSIGAWIVPDNVGIFRFGRLDIPTGSPVAAFREWQERGEVKRLPPSDANAGIPAYRVTIRYARLPTTMTEDQLAGAVPPARRAALQQEWQESVSENTAIKTVHLLAQEVTFDTCLTEPSDAAAEAARRLAIYSVRRDVWKFRVSVLGPGYQPAQSSVDPFAPTLPMGSIVTLQMSRFLKTPKLLVLIGRVDDAVADVIEFSAWG